MILGIETATTICSVGLATPERVIAEIGFDIKNVHDHVLSEAIAQLLRLARVPMPEVRAIAVSAGPGSFTGLRIGMSVAKGLAFTHNKPMLGVSTLLLQACAAVPHAAAYAAAQKMAHGTIVPILGSRRHEIYAAEFELASPLPLRKSNERVLKVHDFAGMLSSRSIICGNGIAALRDADLLEQLREHYFVAPERARLNGGLVARVGQILFARGESTTAEILEPHYVQDFEIGAVAPRTAA